MGERVVCRNRRIEAAVGEAAQGRSGRWEGVPVEGDVSEVIIGYAITTKGSLPIIQHGSFPGFSHRQARIQNASLKCGPRREVNVRRGKVGPGRQDQVPEQAGVQNCQGREPRGGYIKIYLLGVGEKVLTIQ